MNVLIDVAEVFIAIVVLPWEGETLEVLDKIADVVRVEE